MVCSSDTVPEAKAECNVVNLTRYVFVASMPCRGKVGTVCDQ